MAMRTLLAALLAVVVSPLAFGHGGGLDRNGCHTNRKTGDYHCHGGGIPSPAPSGRSAPQIRPAAAQTVIAAAPTSRNNDLVRAAQVLLAALDYKPTLLGTLDERTRSAVRAFQREEKITADGAVNEYLVLRLAERVAAKCR